MCLQLNIKKILEDKCFDKTPVFVTALLCALSTKSLQNPCTVAMEIL